jgi:hypothetical protein
MIRLAVILVALASVAYVVRQAQYRCIACRRQFSHIDERHDHERKAHNFR